MGLLLSTMPTGSPHASSSKASTGSMHAHVTYKSQGVNTGDGDTAHSGECTFVVRYTDKIKVGSRIVWEDRTYLVRKDPRRYKTRGYVEADAQLINM